MIDVENDSLIVNFLTIGTSQTYVLSNFPLCLNKMPIFQRNFFRSYHYYQENNIYIYLAVTKHLLPRFLNMKIDMAVIGLFFTPKWSKETWTFSYHTVNVHFLSQLSQSIFSEMEFILKLISVFFIVQLTANCILSAPWPYDDVPSENEELDFGKKDQCSKCLMNQRSFNWNPGRRILLMVTVSVKSL